MAKPEVHRRNPGNLPARIPRRYGRPRRIRFPEDLPLDFEDKMEEWGMEGLSITEVRANLDIGVTVWLRWFREWPEFRETVERFLDLSESWWLSFGRQNLGNKFFNGGLYMTQMALRFKYPRQLEHHLETQGNAQDTEAIEKAEDLALEDLFSGADPRPVEQPKAKRTMPMPEADDAEWMDAVDLRSKPK
jgi:hypothetical protein